MSATDVITVEVPDIGDFDEVPIIEILVAAGDSVGLDDALLTLESDKATMDVPAPFAGVVRELRVKVGDRVSQGTPLLTLEAADAGAAGNGAGGSKAAAVASEGAPTEASAPGALESASEAETASEAPPSSPSSADSPASSQSPPAPPAPANGGGPIYASPAVRRLARERGIDLSQVTASGRKGRITKSDVEQFLDGGGRAAAPAQAAPAAAAGDGLALLPWPSLNFEKFGEIERVPRSRIQKISAPNLVRNWVMIPHVTHNDEADITDLEAWRKQLNDEHAKAGVKFTMVSFLVVACVAALKQYPDFNASLDGDELILKRYYNIGFAADTPGGLVVPVIKDADKKGLKEIASDLATLSAKARDGKLGPADMSGSTFTISSLGGIGGTSFTPIVNAPEVAILGVTRSAMKPVWNGRDFEPRLMVPLSLSYDHRVIDGAAAARFVVSLVKAITDLRRALL
jgi:pyruvate dehydrogenase E2 component (dihydrolipoamide acetyltransferase)